MTTIPGPVPMIRRTADAVRGLGPGMRVLFTTTLIVQTGSVVLPFLTAYLVDRHRYPVAQVGLIVALYGIGGLAADLCAGPLLRAAAPRTVMAAGLAGNAVTVGCLPFLQRPAALMAATALWGFCYEIFMPASYLETVRRAPERDLRIAFSLNRLAINLGMGVGPVIGAVLFGRHPGALFGLNAVAALAAALYLVSRPAAPPAPPAAAEPAGDRSRPARGDARFWAVLVASVPIHIAYALPLTFLSVYILRYLHLSGTWVGLVFAVSAGSIVLFEIPLNAAMRDVSTSRSLVTGYALAAAGFAVMGAVRSGPALLAATLLWTAAEMLVFPGLMHYVAQVSSPGRASRNMSLYSAVMSTGLIIAPQLALSLAGHAGPSSPWYLAGAAVAAGLVVIVVLLRGAPRAVRAVAGRGAR